MPTLQIPDRQASQCWNMALSKVRLQIRGRSLFSLNEIGRSRGTGHPRTDEPLNTLDRTGQSQGRSKSCTVASSETEKTSCPAEEEDG